MDRVEFALENLGGKILDVGYSVGGIHQKFIEKFGAENIYGVDIETRENSGHYKRASAERIPFDSGFFDSIFAGELIEHVYTPEIFLREANRVLKIGGALVMTTPNQKSIINRIFRSYQTKIHVSLFDEESLKKMLAQTGFAVEKFYCQPYSGENCYGSRNKWSFEARAFLHKVLPRSLQEQMIVKAVKVN
ncbi:MAG TPA: class I SAM-dependent methyltransferase [archaeon]|nr:class I SAM-dependent methyltransferase [archaeon]